MKKVYWKGTTIRMSWLARILNWLYTSVTPPPVRERQLLRKRILASLPDFLRVLSNPVVLDNMKDRGYTVDWKAVSDLMADVTGFPSVVKLIKENQP